MCIPACMDPIKEFPDFLQTRGIFCIAVYLAAAGVMVAKLILPIRHI